MELQAQWQKRSAVALVGAHSGCSGVRVGAEAGDMVGVAGTGVHSEADIPEAAHTAAVVAAAVVEGVCSHVEAGVWEPVAGGSTPAAAVAVYYRAGRGRGGGTGWVRTLYVAAAGRADAVYTEIAAAVVMKMGREGSRSWRPWHG